MLRAPDPVDRRDWLLVLLALRDSSESLDPVRLQKGMFLLAQEGSLPEAEQYSFRAYDYGPLSAEIYSDVDALVDQRLVERLAAPGYSWSRYLITDEGFDAATGIVRSLLPEREAAVVHLAEIKRNILQGQDFAGLLKYVYAKYPDYAENSVFRG